MQLISSISATDYRYDNSAVAPLSTSRPAADFQGGADPTKGMAPASAGGEFSGNLKEIPYQPGLTQMEAASPSGAAVLKEDASSGNLPAKVVTAIYALNHSFDVQKSVLDLIA